MISVQVTINLFYTIILFTPSLMFSHLLVFSFISNVVHLFPVVSLLVSLCFCYCVFLCLLLFSFQVTWSVTPFPVSGSPLLVGDTVASPMSSSLGCGPEQRALSLCMWFICIYGLIIWIDLLCFLFGFRVSLHQHALNVLVWHLIANHLVYLRSLSLPIAER